MAVNVRFGSKADMTPRNLDVRFTPKSGHRLSVLACPLCAKRGHQDYSFDHFIINFVSNIGL
jgi:hypothetical protein